MMNCVANVFAKEKNPFSLQGYKTQTIQNSLVTAFKEVS